MSDAESDRQAGCFYGCAVGDALGVPLEFQDRDILPLVREMEKGKNWNIAAGSWTDDTSMMLCLGASLVASGGKPDRHSQLAHYSEWHANGYLSVCGICFDIGRTCTKALARFERTGQVTADTTDELDQGNGSLMRIAAVPTIFWSSPREAWRIGADSSLATHAHPVCVSACGLYAYICALAIQGKPKAQLLEAMAAVEDEVHADIGGICRGNFLRKSRDEIRSTGYVLDTLEAALWAFFRTENFEAGAVLAVNLAGDADTVGAVYGTLAGAYYGKSGIPTRWFTALQGRQLLDGVFADCATLAAAALAATLTDPFSGTLPSP